MAETTRPATMREAFATAVDNLRLSYPAAWMLYLRRLQPVEYAAGTLVIGTPDERCQFVCERRLRRLVDQEMEIVTGRPVATRYVVEEGAPC